MKFEKRKIVLWIIGRDLLKPYVKPPDKNAMYVLRDDSPGLWRFVLVDKNIFFIETKKAPNFIHRFMQRVILGFKWELIG